MKLKSLIISPSYTTAPGSTFAGAQTWTELRFWNWKTLTSACIIGRMKPCQTSPFRTMVAPDRPGLR